MQQLFTRALLLIIFFACEHQLFAQAETQNTGIGLYWRLKGNASIGNPAVPVTYGTTLIAGTENWIGTTDARDFVIGTDNIERMRVMQSTGYVGIGTAVPTAALMVRTPSTTANAKVASLANAIGDPAFQLITTRGATTNNTGDMTMQMGQAYGAAGAVTDGIRFFRGVGGSDGALGFVTNTTERMRIISTGLVGVNATVPATYVDINGDLALREGTALALANGANATIAPGATSHVRITGPTAAFSVAGLTGGVNGKVITLINTTAQDMTLLHNSAATLANGFFNPSSANYTLAGQYNSVTLIYNSTLARWVLKASPLSSDPTDWNLTGNTGITTPGTPAIYGTTAIAATENWMGTTDANDVVWGTNNIERMRLKQTTGYIGIGTVAPAATTEIYANSTVPTPQLLLRENGNDYARLSFMNTNTAAKYWTNSAILNAATDASSVWNVYYGSTSTNIFSVAGDNQVGIMVNQAPNTTLDVNGDFALREGLSPVFANGVNNNVVIGGTSHIAITGPTAAFSITGIAGGVNGKMITFINTTAQPMTLIYNSAASLAANRIYSPSGSDYLLNGIYNSVTLIYNSSIARWVVKSSADNATGNFWSTTGNAGTTAANFLGTTDAMPLRIRTNNSEKLTVAVDGSVGIGVATPADQLVVGSATSSAPGRRIRVGSQALNDAESGRLTFDENISTYTGTVNYCGLEFRHDGSLNKLFLEGGCVAASNIMTFERAGDVGINTIDPTQALEIGGTAAQIYMNSATSNMLTYSTVGVAAPTLTTRSTGTKIVFYPQVSATEVDYAMGIAGSTLWSSVPDAVSGYNHRWYGGTTELMRLRGDGRLGIGIAAPTATRLHCYDPSIATSRIAIFRNGGADGTEIQTGSIEYIHDYANTTDFNNGANSVGLSINFAAASGYDLQLAFNSAAKPTSNAWTIVSDERLKEDIHPFKDGLEVLEKINPVYWKYNGKAKTPSNEYGVGILAQDMQKVAPYTISTMEYVDPKVPFEQISENKEQYLAYNSGPLEYVVLNAVKELSQKQKNAEQILVNTTEFGSAILTAMETEITYPQTFTHKCASVPVVTLSTLNNNAQLTITGKSLNGFKVKVVSAATFPIEIDWIAIAKTNPAVLAIEKDYSDAERQEMLSKVKLTPGRIRLQQEEEEAKRRKVEEEKARTEEERISKIPMPNYPSEKQGENSMPGDADVKK